MKAGLAIVELSYTIGDSGGQTTKREMSTTVTTRQLTADERRRLAAGCGVEDLQVTCQGDVGYGPCGTYLDWRRGRCSKGHKIEIVVNDDDE